MKKAGPCRGINRATAHASIFVAIYVLTGLILLLLAGALFSRGEEMGGLMAVHTFSGIVLWLPAVAINWVLLRIFRPRSWRHQAWRAWVAGILAVPLNWIGLSICTQGRFERYVQISGPFTGELESFLFMLGLAIMFLNGSIAFAWALPPWGRPGHKTKDTVPKRKSTGGPSG